MRTISLEDAEEKYGKEEKDGKDVYKTIFGSPDLFNWDHGTMSMADSDSPGRDFFEALDRMLKPHGLEVVQVGFQGDCFPWRIDTILKEGTDGA